ncbi:uncharacterized protein LOC113211968 [Frankliniella occidentalis]|uniref:Uncharacterized protein LOC113211968 n=1 Tax=Frankliniella occidentalis TaxID=133901 RepID=A0A6J1SZF4_FRAOC|nr:uncharacterized protein LOC113211968 [Frankliniella occidentalis]
MKTRSAVNSDSDNKLHRRFNRHSKTEDTSSLNSSVGTSSDSDEEPEDKEVPSTNFSTNRNVYLYCCIVLFIVLIPFTWYHVSQKNSEENQRENLIKTIKDLKKIFPSQSNKLWSHVIHVINVTNSDSSCPRVLLLLNRGDELSENSTNCLIEQVASSAATLFANRQPLHLVEKDFQSINKTREKVQKKGPIVVIKHLEKLPAAAAHGLHYFCDENESNFAKAAYFLTLTVGRSGTVKAVTSAENTLRNIWSDIESDYLDALIARLTSLVEFVEPEEKLPC